MKCPNCGVEAIVGAVDCAGCGVIFAKFKAKKERIVLEAETGLTSADKTDAEPPIARWKVRAVAIGFVVLWMGSFALYYYYALTQPAVSRP